MKVRRFLFECDLDASVETPDDDYIEFKMGDGRVYKVTVAAIIALSSRNELLSRALVLLEPWAHLPTPGEAVSLIKQALTPAEDKSFALTQDWIDKLSSKHTAYTLVCASAECQTRIRFEGAVVKPTVRIFCPQCSTPMDVYEEGSL